jgi:hypothetical protein
MERPKPPYLIAVAGEKMEKTNLTYHQTKYEFEETLTLI